MAKPDDLRSLFERAMNLPEPARSRWMATLDDASRDELESLLEHVEEGRDYFRSVTQVLFGEPEHDPFTDDPLELLGKDIAGYTVVELLGQGGMGVVYKGYDPKLARAVAIKLLAPGQHLSDVARDRFLNEAQLISRLDHPNIGTVYGHEQTDQGLDALIMAFYDGNTLAERIEAKTLNGDALLSIGRAVLDALRYAHAEGVIHKDIKPANLMLLPGGQVKILDFGAAAYLEQEQEDTAVPIGTTAYMSPEQIRGEPLTGATDLWSLGVVLFEAAICLGWLDRVNAFTWSQNPAASNKRAPKAIEQLLLALLVVDPAERLKAVEALYQSDRLPQWMSPKRRWRLNWPTAVVTAAVITLGGFWWQWMGQKSYHLPDHRKLALHYEAGQTLDSALAVDLSGRLTTLAHDQGNISYVGLFADGDDGLVNPDGVDPDNANLNWQLTVTDASDEEGMDPDTIRLTLALIDNVTGDTLTQWQHHYPRARLDLIPSDLYQQVLTILEVQPAGIASLEAQESITNPAAYALYLEGLTKLNDYLSDLDISKQNNLSEAVDRFTRANQMSPQATYQLGLARAKSEQFQLNASTELLNDAVFWANQALTSNPNLVDGYMVLASLYSSRRETGSAIAAYQLALRQQPNRVDAMLALARIHIKDGRFEEAEPLLDRALTVDPEHWRTHSMLGVADHYAQRYDQAMQHYYDALKRAPGNRLVRSNLAVLLADRGAYEKVIELYEGLNDEVLDGYEALNLAVANFYMGSLESAIRYYRLSAATMKDHQAIWGQLALTQLIAEGDDSENARQSYQRALSLALNLKEMAPSSISLRAAIASYHSGLGQHEQALAELNHAMSLWRNKPDSSGPDELKTLITAGLIVYERLGEREQALSLLKEGVARAYNVNDLLRMPYLSSLKADPRFKQILKL